MRGDALWTRADASGLWLIRRGVEVMKRRWHISTNQRGVDGIQVQDAGRLWEAPRGRPGSFKREGEAARGPWERVLGFRNPPYLRKIIHVYNKDQGCQHSSTAPRVRVMNAPQNLCRTSDTPHGADRRPSPFLLIGEYCAAPCGTSSHKSPGSPRYGTSARKPYFFSISGGTPAWWHAFPTSSESPVVMPTAKSTRPRQEDPRLGERPAPRRFEHCRCRGGLVCSPLQAGAA
jgi:hypothetical protein